MVDGLADPEEIVVKPLSAVLKDIGLYSGATVLGNADLALILDPGSIALKAGVTMSAEEEAAARGRRREKRMRPRAWNTCWWKRPDGRPRCRWPTCCASSSCRFRASSTSATGRC